MTKLYYWKVAKVFEATRIVKAQTGKPDFQSIKKKSWSEGVKKIGFLVSVKLCKPVFAYRVFQRKKKTSYVMPGCDPVGPFKGHTCGPQKHEHMNATRRYQSAYPSRKAQH